MDRAMELVKSLEVSSVAVPLGGQQGAQKATESGLLIHYHEPMADWNFDAAQASAERIALDPKYHEALTLVKGIRNGIVYGTKVRFPHALV